MRSKDDAGVIDRPCQRAPLRGKPGAYALKVHSGAKLDCVFVYLPNFNITLSKEILCVYVTIALYVVGVMFSNKLRSRRATHIKNHLSVSCVVTSYEVGELLIRIICIRLNCFQLLANC